MIAIRPELARVATLAQEEPKGSNGSSQGWISESGCPNITQDVEHDFCFKPVAFENQFHCNLRYEMCPKMRDGIQHHTVNKGVECSTSSLDGDLGLENNLKRSANLPKDLE